MLGYRMVGSLALVVFFAAFKFGLSVDYCKDLENAPGIPKISPKTSYIVKSCHRKNMAGWQMMASELNMTVTVNDQIPNEDVDIVWSPFYPVDVKPGVMYIMGPEFDIFPGDRHYSGWNGPRYTEGHAFYTALSVWNLDVHAGMGGWMYPMVSLKFPVDVKQFKSTVSREERKGGFIYFKRRQPELLEKVQEFIKNQGIEDVTLFHYVKR